MHELQKAVTMALSPVVLLRELGRQNEMVYYILRLRLAEVFRDARHQNRKFGTWPEYADVWLFEQSSSWHLKKSCKGGMVT